MPESFDDDHKGLLTDKNFLKLAEEICTHVLDNDFTPSKKKSQDVWNKLNKKFLYMWISTIGIKTLDFDKFKQMDYDAFLKCLKENRSIVIQQLNYLAQFKVVGFPKSKGKC